MPRPVTIRRSLLTNLMLVIVLLSGAIILITFVGSREAVRTLARSLIESTMGQARLRLGRFLDPVRGELGIARAWGEAGLLDLERPERIDRLVAPLIRQHPQISSLLVADDRGREYMLLRTPGRWLRRVIRRDEWESRARFLEWGDGAGDPAASEREVDYDPRDLPWYRGAVAARGRTFWSEPYIFYTTRRPGITAAVRFTTSDGRVHVVGFDVLLSDISAFTTGVDVAGTGILFVLTDGGQIVGLPRHPGFENPADRQAALLARPENLGIPVLADAVRSFADWPAGRRKPTRFQSGGEAWWVQARPFPLSPERTFRIAVAVPESELLGGLRQERTWIVLITLGALLLAILQAVLLARRFSLPIEALARQSDRMSQGKLRRPEAPIRSTVKEVRRLAASHDRMRDSLRSLLRLEGDLQLARRIQQGTFPEALPEIRGFDLHAWSEPAAETGGDTYDVIGCPASTERAEDGAECERVVLLLADATGHGIGPALSVTQVRAMLRIAVRMGGNLLEIARHLNEQLCADLPAGPFITAWLGELSAADQTLTSFSAGQAPILHYRAGEDEFEVRAADAVPLGIVTEMPDRLADPVTLGSGDIVAAISDGILEARNPARRQFGADRAMAVVRTHRRETSEEIVDALRAAVVEFTEGAPPGDDRTVIVVKRRG